MSGAFLFLERPELLVGAGGFPGGADGFAARGDLVAAAPAMEMNCAAFWEEWLNASPIGSGWCADGSIVISVSFGGIDAG